MPSDPARMNVVFIMADQQRWDMLGCYGNDWIRTPHLDRLAASGCRFNAAYTTQPVCTPARAGLFTGMWPSSSGASANQLSPYRSTALLGEILSSQGITAGYIGKWHLSGAEGAYYGSGKPDGGFLPEYWYDGRCFIQDVGLDGFEKWRKGEDLAPEDCWGHRLADRAVQFLEDHAGDDQPFYLSLSFDEPHGPSSAPERYYDMYRGTQRPWQENMGDDLSDKPAVHRAFAEAQNHRGVVPEGTPPNNSPRYYGCTTFLDEEIGRVLDAIDRLCGENTAVIFTTDHGDHAGAHGLIAKGPTMYEEICRVPLLIRAPGLAEPGSVCDSLISHIHLAPTVCRLLGVQPHAQFQATEATGLLRDPAGSVTDAIFMEYDRFGLPHSNNWGFWPSRCIRTRRYKLVLNLLDRDELYDLEADPGETINRIEDASLASVRNDLHDTLLEWMERRVDPRRGKGWYTRPWRPEKTLAPDAINPYYLRPEDRTPGEDIWSIEAKQRKTSP